MTRLIALFTLLAASTLGAFACATLTGVVSGVKYEALDLDVKLEPRGEGCHVDVFELGREAEHEHPFKITGTLVWTLSKTQLRELAPKDIENRIHQAACRYGLFVISEVTAYPSTKTGGVVYEAKGGVLTDAEGRFLNQSSSTPSKEPSSKETVTP